MTEIAIHTSAPLTMAKELAREPHAGKIKVFAGQAAFGQPDCMYGWGELAADSDCVRHTLIVTSDHDAAMRMARQLVAGNFECLLTDSEDWSIPYVSSAAVLYRDQHRH